MTTKQGRDWDALRPVLVQSARERLLHQTLGLKIKPDLIDAIEAVAVAEDRARLRAAVERLTGYTNGTTIDGDDVWSGMEASDAEPGSIQHKGDWLQRGPILALLDEQP